MLGVTRAQFTDGNKSGSLHSQRGLPYSIPHEDCLLIIMPLRKMKNPNTGEMEPIGNSFTADVYTSPASIVFGQTNGMIYESDAAWRATKDGRKGMEAVYNLDDLETEEYTMVLNPWTGAPFIRRTRTTNKPELVKATVEMVLLIAQTQTTGEKHHLTHNLEGKYSLIVVLGRGTGALIVLST